MFFKKLNLIKYKLVRFIESKPSLNLFIYNNIRFLRFLLPHEKDFDGMLLVCKNDRDLSILDIGANLGISLLGFRQLGFINKIYAFEPNHYLYKNFFVIRLFFLVFPTFRLLDFLLPPCVVASFNNSSSIS